MNRKFVVANWKMHKGPSDARRWCEGLLEHEVPESVDVGVCPPFVSIPVVAMILEGTKVIVGAQNLHWEAEGAFTGEVSAPMLREVGASMVIVGHSERRHIFGEDDETVARKAKAAQEHGMEIILCIGELEKEREAGKTYEVLSRQLQAVRGLDPSKLIIAYEPVWAIGTGKTATAEQAREAHAFVRDELMSILGDSASKVRILYGGSIKPGNAFELFSQPGVDGGLVGGASLDPSSFFDIIRQAARAAEERC